MSYPESKERNNLIVALRSQGQSYRAIGRIFRLHHKTVQEILERQEYREKAGVGSRSRKS